MTHKTAEPFVQGLNPRQAEAVLAVDGPLLILAGAGSGKTRVLTRRIAYLLATGRARRHEVLAVTFTNKAAREMGERVTELCGPGRFPDLGTFHSVCARWLRRYGHLIGLDSSFTIYAGAEQQVLMKEVFADFNLDSKAFRPQSFLAAISGWKNRLISPEVASRTARYQTEELQAKAYALYQRKLEQNRSLDFDDLLLKSVTLLRDDHSLLEQMQERLKYLSIDEYQDVNPVQYELIKLLGGGRQNVCAVGDDDQSIYAFRGADLSIILRFEDDFPEAQVIRLEQNYRSTEHILEAANKVVAHNLGRKQKNLWTEQKGGHKLELHIGFDGRDEARYIASTIGRLRRETPVPRSLNDFVVLYRTNAQSRLLEEAMIGASLPYQIIGGLRFFERKEIKDLLSYLRVLNNPLDSVSLRRIINEPRRGVGASSVEKLLNYSDQTQIPFFFTLERSEDAGLSGKAARAVRELSSWMQDLAQKMAGSDALSITELLEAVLSHSGYRKVLKEDRSVEAQARLENIQELLNVTQEFDRARSENLEADNEIPESALESFLVEVSLLSDQDRSNDSTEMVTLMTLHSAKGLEFPIVFLAGLEEETFPHVRSMADPQQMEEERRLCYVGLTRAMERLFLTAARTRAFAGGDSSVRKISRFVEEIPDELFSSPPAQSSDLRASSAAGREAPAIGSPNWQGWGRTANSRVKAEVKTESFQVGDLVSHKVFGKGEVKAAGEIVTVEFHNGVTRKLKSSFLSKEKSRAKEVAENEIPSASRALELAVGGQVRHSRWGGGQIVAMREATLTVAFPGITVTIPRSEVMTE